MKPGQIVIVALAAGCALLGLGVALLLAGVGQRISSAPPMERQEWVDAVALDEEEPGLPPLESYAEVNTRPLFNNDRQPAPPDLSEDESDGDDIEDQPMVELNVTVTGIIITPGKKLAMVVDNTTQQQQRLTEGMPLEGEQSSWTLTTIEPRKLVFDGTGSGPREVELETYTQALKGGSPARARAAQVAKQQRDQAAADAASGREPTAEEDKRAARAEEIRQRVAERRAQLREEAARRQEEQQQEDDNE